MPRPNAISHATPNGAPVRFAWPAGFPRIPSEEWTRAPVDSLAVKYDAVEKHGWYDNLDPTVEELAARLRAGQALIDYSGGTGILIERLLRAVGDRPIGVVNVDSSPKFLALSLAKLRAEERVAFRLIRYLSEEKRLQTLDEALAFPLRADAIVSTNAIHLYHDLVPTLRAWARVLKPDGFVHIQSGNLKNPDAPRGSWIIDDTVRALDEAARRLVRSDPRWAQYRAVLDDAPRMKRYEALRERYFLPPRPLAHYLDALREAGFVVEKVATRAVTAKTEEWLDFLRVYHEGVLPWIGGSAKVDAHDASPQDVEARLDLMREALRDVFRDETRFTATWTYLTCRLSP